MTVSNVERKRAIKLLTAFNDGVIPKRERKISAPDLGKIIVAIGPLTGVSYLANDGVEYLHRFKKQSRPLLVASSDGKTLGIIGGRFSFTAQGIVDD